MENIEKAVQYVLKKKEYQLEKLTHSISLLTKK